MKHLMDEKDLEQQRLKEIDSKILPQELKPVKKTLWRIILDFFLTLYWKFGRRKRYLIKDIKPVGAPTYRPSEGLVETPPDPEAYKAFVRERGEVITPLPSDSVEDICELMSQAATDREFERVIVYPIQGEKRRQVLELLESPEGKRRYPMFEYFPANIVNNDDLNAKSIIYKYREKSHYSKPI